MDERVEDSDDNVNVEDSDIDDSGDEDEPASRPLQRQRLPTALVI